MQYWNHDFLTPADTGFSNYGYAGNTSLNAIY